MEFIDKINYQRGTYYLLFEQKHIQISLVLIAVLFSNLDRCTMENHSRNWHTAIRLTVDRTMLVELPADASVSLIFPDCNPESELANFDECLDWLYPKN